MFPFWLHGEAQTPEMEHYPGLFTDEYMDDWRHKTIEWEVPVEERIMCDCDAQLFIAQMQPNNPTLFQSCDDCGKTWCIKCGEPERAPFDTQLVHSPATIFCFTCGLKHAGQDWVPGQVCTWKGFGHHP
jgi:hypothetical protein